MNQKIIGITPRYYFNDDKKKFLRVSQMYLDYLDNNDVLYFILTPSTNIEQMLSLCDGFLVIGGDDFDPIHYGQTNELNLSKEIDPVIDTIDKQVIDHAVANKKPLLGICRGLQAIVVTQGGTLHQDIAHDNLNHPHEGIYHKVTKVKNMGVAKLLPDEFTVNTYHHQCADILPEGFHTLLMNGDVIEFIEHETLPIIGAQWHPERLDSEESKIILNYFLDKVKNS